MKKVSRKGAKEAKLQRRASLRPLLPLRLCVKLYSPYISAHQNNSPCRYSWALSFTSSADSPPEVFTSPIKKSKAGHGKATGSWEEFSRGSSFPYSLLLSPFRV